jgi:hypothetical protein
MSTAPYIPKYFALEELVYPKLIRDHDGAGAVFWLTLDAHALVTLDRLRERYGPIVVNDWATGGRFKHSGLRPMDCTEGAALSQHKFGRAFDCKFTQADPAEVRREIIANPDAETFEHITRIEDFPSMGWVHFDVANHDKKRFGVQVVRP